MLKSIRRTRLFGFTLVETIVSAGVFGMLSSAAITGVISLQRNFSNTRDYATNHSAQLRISDYIARDLREAVTFSQTGSGSSLIMTLTIPNYYDSTGNPRTPVVKSDGSIAYQDTSFTPPKETSTICYFINNETMYRQVDGHASPIAESVEEFVIIPVDSTTDPNAGIDFNLNGIASKVAEIKVQVNFKTHFGSKSVAQIFYNTTLMRNSRTDAQTNLY